MIISELEKILEIFKNTHGDVQVALQNCEFFQHSPDFRVVLGRKKDELSSPYPPEESLQEVFLSIRF